MTMFDANKLIWICNFVKSGRILPGASLHSPPSLQGRDNSWEFTQICQILNRLTSTKSRPILTSTWSGTLDDDDAKSAMVSWVWQFKISKSLLVHLPHWRCLKESDFMVIFLNGRLIIQLKNKNSLISSNGLYFIIFVNITNVDRFLDPL